MKSLSPLLFCALIAQLSFAQDTNKVSNIPDVLVLTYPTYRLTPDSIYNNRIVSGKKMEVIVLNSQNTDLSTNNYRQLFKKTPGIYVSEHDASGLQTSISTRGLGANRSWEFNMRQNGYDIAADPSGYPEAYYTPTLDAVAKIDVYRGSSALQYGTQFGGMINYQFKDKLSDQALTVENTQTVGSFGLFNSYTAGSAMKNNWSFMGFVHHRSAEGFRQNSAYATSNYFAKVAYQFKKGKVSTEFSHSSYLNKQSGGIHDSLLARHSDTSLRSRNWFEMSWNTASVQGDFQLQRDFKLQFYAAYTFSDRNSVGFIKALSIPDVINPTTLAYNPRQVDIDHYRTKSSEVRLLKTYKIAGITQTWTGGLRFCDSDIHRLQQGIGTSGLDFDLSVSPDASGYKFQKDLLFGTRNTALFSENLFKIGKRFSISPGFRAEYIANDMSGRTNNLVTGILEKLANQRWILLGGVSSAFQLMEKVNAKMSLYANITQNYRPVMYSELLPSSTTEVVDPNMKDVNGFSSEFGLKSQFVQSFGLLQFDVNAFYLQYNDKIGTLTVDNLPFKTNIGDVGSKGIEFYGELSLFNPFFMKARTSELLSAYISGTVQSATYKRWNNPALVNDPSISIEGKKVEYAPNLILRTGISYDFKEFTINYQTSYTSKVFTDATNTIDVNANATVGLLSAYLIHDLSSSYKISKNFTLKVGVNNLSNEVYATRRSSGYPGPGLLPSQGRSIYGTVSIRL